MNKWRIYRRITAIILGGFWSFRAKINSIKGITLGEYFISFIFVMIIFSVLTFFIIKDLNTREFKIISQEILYDGIWAMLSFWIVKFLIPFAFGWIFS